MKGSDGGNSAQWADYPGTSISVDIDNGAAGGLFLIRV